MHREINSVTAVAVFVALLLVACSGIPPDALVLSPTTLQTRQLETRRFEGGTEEKLLGATAAVLQDLGFALDESETRLGLVVASKRRSATSAGQVAGAILVAALGGGAMPIDKEQLIRASVVVQPASTSSSTILVRVTFQRVITNTHGDETKREEIVDPLIYKGFFDKLSSAVFLEAQGI